ncbi:MAG: dienelactone hydrolase family protein [Anaerolineae bacterium]|nr:dienelactone hydrolase family protein [Anaerolineae bacterium]
MNNELNIIEIGDWMVKHNRPEGEGPFEVILMVHGWTGDENSMWVFGSQLPPKYLMVAPRAPHKSMDPKYGGYSWLARRPSVWPDLEDFRVSVDALHGLIDNLNGTLQGDFSKFHIAGFSQGAAVSYAYALIHPSRIISVAGLAGFMPEKADSAAAAKPLIDIPVFMGHGNQDETVPIEMAYHAQKVMESAGAKVSFCESDVGHKLGANCFRGYRQFMDQQG